ncbi:MAG: hypothetical protein GEU26_15210 [Nitrososphaeraceae archaeon]|nr:hypothetical protein [Nitrososphaeraceae archaeon]
MLLYQDILIIGKSAEQSVPSYMSTSSPIFSSSDPSDIEIVYPNNDQTTKVNSDLEISGTSNYNPSSICHVAVIINDAKPYKKTIPAEGNIESGYFTWRYIIESDSNIIKQGNNKITARLLCTSVNGEDIRKWDSVIVIGQIGTEKGGESPPRETLTVPIEIGTTPGISSPTIEIDRNTLVELITKRIDNSSEDIKDSIKDSILSVYTG